MFKKYEIGRFFGFKVQADLSWVILCIFLLWTFAKTIFPSMRPDLNEDIYWTLSMYAFIGVFISILAHELAHAIVAEAFDIKIRSITLFIFGGVAELDGLPSSPKGEYLMALAGPAMSLFLGVAFYGVADLVQIVLKTELSSLVLIFLAKLNVLIALFNMLPAFPLDGGRALRGFLWGWKGDFVNATKTAGDLGALFGYMMIAYASIELAREDYISAVWWALLGTFLHLACQYALRHAESHTILDGQKAKRFMRSDLKTVGSNLSLRSLMKDFYFIHFFKSYPITRNGVVQGIVHLDQVSNIRQEFWGDTKVSDIMVPKENCVFAHENEEANLLLDKMQNNNLKTIFVIDDEGQVKGIVSYRDLMDYLTIVLKLNPEDGYF